MPGLREGSLLLLTDRQMQSLRELLETRKQDAMIGNVANIVPLEVQASNSGVYNTIVEVEQMINSVAVGDEDDNE